MDQGGWAPRCKCLKLTDRDLKAVPLTSSECCGSPRVAKRHRHKLCRDRLCCDPEPQATLSVATWPGILVRGKRWSSVECGVISELLRRLQRDQGVPTYRAHYYIAETLHILPYMGDFFFCSFLQTVLLCPGGRARSFRINPSL